MFRLYSNLVKANRGLGAKLFYLPYFIKQVTKVLHQALETENQIFNKYKKQINVKQQ